MKIFIPDIYQKSIFTINYDKLKKKGIKCLLFDLDNTISPAKEVVLCKKTKKLLDKLKKDFKIIIFSNNFPKRIAKFGIYYGVDVSCVCLKPFKYKYKYILKKYNFKKDEVAAIGDQLLTDILGGNKMKILTILVDPMTLIDEKETFLNRQIEKAIFKNFKKKDILVKGRYYE
ncbi:MAG: YqeG family HAD IIIA-type phosphatase [Tenericutes bacterium]|nr:YqeG family HAD IIIA-type phosphatase [Mycoplasmatota bacterium]